MTTLVDALVIGAGIAGLSAGAELALDRSVAVLEAESAPAQHTTGRSAAVYIERYGGPAIAPFNRASHAWYASAAAAIVEHPLLADRGMLAVAPPGSVVHPEMQAEMGARVIDAHAAVELFPALRPEAIGTALFVAEAADLDAAAAVVAFRRLLRDRDGTLVTGARVERLERRDGAWEVSTAGGTWRAGIVVDAAGAWADAVAAMAGLPPVGLRPLRRTICAFPAPPGRDSARWPLLMDADERFYLKPEPGHFLASPADETPSEPCDPRPDMLDIATALERVRETTTLEARSVSSSWAGLRTFAPDRVLVLGPDPLEPSFVWCAGQGGFGIQCSPAAGRAVVALTDRGTLPDDIVEQGGDVAAVLPDRLRS
jgi:D-arginine dehydrogenase